MAAPVVGSYVIVRPEGVVNEIGPNFIELVYQVGDEFEVSEERPPYNNAQNMRPLLKVGDFVFSVLPGRVDRIGIEGDEFYVRFDDGKGLAPADPGNNMNGMNVFIPPNRPPLAPGEPLRANAPEYVPLPMDGGRRRLRSRRSTRRSSRLRSRRSTRRSSRLQSRRSTRRNRSRGRK